MVVLLAGVHHRHESEIKSARSPETPHCRHTSRHNPRRHVISLGISSDSKADANHRRDDQQPELLCVALGPRHLESDSMAVMVTEGAQDLPLRCRHDQLEPPHPPLKSVATIGVPLPTALCADCHLPGKQSIADRRHVEGPEPRSPRQASLTFKAFAEDCNPVDIRSLNHPLLMEESNPLLRIGPEQEQPAWCSGEIHMRLVEVHDPLP
mmetsp:Transcript_108661/g.232132  ORF Transcript_108661/g.232132 Transcript_108661/m.232132 type:complete len:209 (+) Transcript_108661:1619-2245(+)